MLDNELSWRTNFFYQYELKVYEVMKELIIDISQSSKIWL